MPKTVFAIVAHPDDIEFVMAGTMIHLRDAGCELHYMTVANGCCGSMKDDAETTAKIRRQESINAAEFIGATYHESLVNDLEIFYDRPTLLRLASIVREVAPDILLTHSPQDYMEDHMNTSRLVVTSAFSRGMPNFPVTPPTAIAENEVTIYHAQPHGNQDAIRQRILPDFYVNIDGQIEQKAQMLALHASQKEWLDESQGMESYIHSMKQLSKEVGDLSGCFTFAEGWRRHSHLGFCQENSDPMLELLPADSYAKN